MAERIAVVGGGVVGLTSALMLADAGFAVTVIDHQGERFPPSLGNAGHIGIEQTAPLASMATLRRVPRLLFGGAGPLSLPPRAMGAWLPWGLKLMAASGRQRFESGRIALTGLLTDVVPAWRRVLKAALADDLLIQTGHKVLWENARSARGDIAALAAEPPGPARHHVMSAAELSEAGEGLAIRPVAGVRFENTGQMADLIGLRDALRAGIEARGGALTSGRVAALTPTASGVTLTLDSGDSIAADRAVIAAGVHSRPLMESLGHRTPLIAERGYHIEVDADPNGGTRPPIVFEDRSIVVTRFAKILRMTGFTEFAHPATPPDARKWATLERHARDLGLPFDGPRRWFGPRPTLPDYLPAIGISTRQPRIAYGFGHQHLGLTMAAVTAERLTAMIGGGGANTPNPFAIERFG